MKASLQESMCAKMSIQSDGSVHRHRRFVITRLVDKKHVYLCTPADPAAGIKAFVAKVAASPYPWELHNELSQIGLAPGLTAPLGKWPGGVEVVYMDFLDPADGWVPLRAFSGDWTALEKLIESALDQLHKCTGGKAVHGDLHSDNVFVRSV